MSIGNTRLSDFGSWVLVVCAVLTTALVARRELLVTDDSADAVPPDKPYSVGVQNWEAALDAGLRLGPEDATLQVVEFADFQCPYCARFEATVRAVRAKYPDQVAFVFAHYPLAQHAFAESSARAAECAHDQDRFDEMRTLLFAKQQVFGSVPWTEMALQAGMPNIDQFSACVNATQPLERIEQSRDVAEEIGIRGTPTILVNGWLLSFPRITGHRVEVR